MNKNLDAGLIGRIQQRGVSVIQVVSGLEIRHGGPSYSVPRLNASLIEAGFNSKIFADLALGDMGLPASNTIEVFVRDFGTVPFLKKLHFCAEMQRRLLDSGSRFDLVHSHGLWRFPNIYAARMARKRHVPHIISPRGMLSRVALNYSRRAKWLFWHALQKLAVDEAACLHATCLSEFYEFRSLGIRQPIAIVPNGIDLPDVAHFGAPSRDSSSRTLLFFGRIHEKKGLDILIPAWVRVAASYPYWRLRIVGPGEPEDTRKLAQLILKHKAPRVSIEGAVYGNDKWRILSEADLFVLPTRNENFGITVAESLACRRPVIVTKGAPWSGVEAHRCGWWVGTDELALVEGLMAALGTPDGVLDDMGQRGAAWMKQDFAWDKIGLEMARVYDWILGRGPRPDCVDVLDGYKMADFNER